MSRHLQVLPKLHEPAAGKENVDSNIAGRKRSRSRQSEKEGFGKSDENYCWPKISEDVSNKSCQTPKSDANKIPKTLTCPAAPKKPIRRAGVLSCKRKLMPELEFFEADRRKEVDEFFRSSSASTAKSKVAAAATSPSVADSSSSCSSPPLYPARNSPPI